MNLSGRLNLREGGSELDWSLGDQGWARGLGLSPGLGSGARPGSESEIRLRSGSGEARV